MTIEKIITPKGYCFLSMTKQTVTISLRYLAISLLPSRLYCRFWNLTKSCFHQRKLADFTADREFHPALKSYLYCCTTSIILYLKKARGNFSPAWISFLISRPSGLDKIQQKNGFSSDFLGNYLLFVQNVDCFNPRSRVK